MGVIIRQSIKATAISYVGAFLGFLTTFVILTRYLTAEEVGLTRLLIDAATMLSGVSTLGTTSSIIRFFPYFKAKGPDDKNQNSHNGFWFWTVTIPLLGILLFSLLWVLLKQPAAQYFGKNSALFVRYFYWVIPISAFMVYQSVMESNANVLMRIVWPRLVREVVTRILALAVYLLYAFDYLTLDGFVAAFSGIYLIAALCNTVYLYLYGHISMKPDFSFPDKSLIRNYGFYTTFVMASVLGAALTPLISSSFVSAQMGLEFTGIFAIATYMSAMVTMPYRSLGAIVSPQLSEATKNQDWNQVNQLCRSVATNMLVACGLITALIWFNIDFIYRVLPNGETYLMGRNVVLLLCVSQVLYSCLSVCNNVLNFSKHYYYSLVLVFLLAASGVVLNNWLIPLWGINGAATATLLANVIYFGLMQVLLRVVTHTNPFEKEQLWLLLILGITFGLNEWITPLCINHSLLVDFALTGCKTLVLLGADALLVWRFNLAPDLINLIKSKI